MTMDTTTRVLCYLSAWERGLPISGGLAHAAQVKERNLLEPSWDALGRIDAFLDDLREREHPEFSAFLQRTENVNLLYLLAFHVGEVRARTVRLAAKWATWDEMISSQPQLAVFGEGFHSSFVQVQPGTFLPLVSICSRLFEGPEEKSVQFSAGGVLFPFERDPPEPKPPSHLPLPPVEPESLVPDFPARFEALYYDARAEYSPVRWPQIPDEHALARTVADLPTLLRSGRVVWGAIVQANTKLTDPEYGYSAPGDVLYDPQGRISPEDLRELAQGLFALKGTRPEDPDQRFYADHLAGELSVVRAWPVPPSVLPYPLCVSTVLFVPSVLPGRAIALPVLPVLICDQLPGSAMVAPWQVWPEHVYAAWRKAFSQRYPQATIFSQPSALPVPRTPTDKEEIEGRRAWESGLWASNAGMESAAITLWEDAAALGHYMATDTLASVYWRKSSLGEDQRMYERYLHHYRQAQGIVLHRIGPVEAARQIMTQSPKAARSGLDALKEAEQLLINAKLSGVEGTMPLREKIMKEQATRSGEWLAELRELGITIEPAKSPSNPPGKGWLKRLFGSK
jgi:hypothetical protein